MAFLLSGPQHQLSHSISMKFSIHLSQITLIALEQFKIFCVEGKVSQMKWHQPLCVCVRVCVKEMIRQPASHQVSQGRSRQRECDTPQCLCFEVVPSQAFIMSGLHSSMSYPDCDLPQEVPCHICINNCICFRVTLLACHS